MIVFCSKLIITVEAYVHKIFMKHNPLQTSEKIWEDFTNIPLSSKIYL